MMKSNLLASAALLLVIACGDQYGTQADARYSNDGPDATAPDAHTGNADARAGYADAPAGYPDAPNSSADASVDSATVADSGTVDATVDSGPIDLGPCEWTHLTGTPDSEYHGRVTSTDGSADTMCSLPWFFVDSNIPSPALNLFVTFDPTVFPDGANTSIVLADGIIIDKSGAVVTITGSGATTVVIDGNGAVPLFTSTQQLTISAVTLQNGLALPPSAQHVGGGAITSSALLTVRECSINFNSAPQGVVTGGGIGGAIYASGGLTVSGSDFTGNNANSGGAIAMCDGTVSDSTFTSNSGIQPSTHNSTQATGGAITIVGGGQCPITSGSSSITRSTFDSNEVLDSNNVVSGLGGAIVSHNTRVNTVTNCTFVGNQASVGSAIATDLAADGQRGAAMSIAFATVFNSSGPNTAAAVQAFGASIAIKNSVVAGTVGAADIGSFSVGGTIPSVFSDGHNIYGTVDTHFVIGTGDFSGGTIPTTSLADNASIGATLTQTLAIPANSIAVGHVPSQSCTDYTNSALTTDQRGYPRPHGSSEGQLSGTCDVGAFQHQPSDSP